MLWRRWRRRGDRGGGRGAGGARHQRAVHRHVWKDVRVPAGRTNRSLTDYSEPTRPFLHNRFCSPLCINVLTCPGTCEDYRLLENMNKLTSLKYMEMKDISINISRNLQDLNNKCAWSASLLTAVFYLQHEQRCVSAADVSLQPYLDQINQIEEQVSSLEQAAYKLDTYSKKLGKTLDVWHELWRGTHSIQMNLNKAADWWQIDKTWMSFHLENKSDLFTNNTNFKSFLIKVQQNRKKNVTDIFDYSPTLYKLPWILKPRRTSLITQKDTIQ